MFDAVTHFWNSPRQKWPFKYTQIPNWWLKEVWVNSALPRSHLTTLFVDTAISVSADQNQTQKYDMLYCKGYQNNPQKQTNENYLSGIKGLAFPFTRYDITTKSRRMTNDQWLVWAKRQHIHTKNSELCAVQISSQPHSQSQAELAVSGRGFHAGMRVPGQVVHAPDASLWDCESQLAGMFFCTVRLRVRLTVMPARLRGHLVNSFKQSKFLRTFI